MLHAERYHDISCGHRLVGHEGKCKNLHGHNYRVHFVCEASSLDDLGRVIDFGAIKTLLCNWVDDHWDHRMLLWIEDPFYVALRDLDPSVVGVPFNPTAENLAQWLVTKLGPEILQGTSVRLVEVRIEETRKCSVTYRL
ncbi:6-carboxytetrahydropterin synthase [Paraburkholderia sp. UYCP14C]|uniref:6-pyruvoyl trahydropterin synthase family protein n=1 Tax=Paraburkholderia sp. UYCP14C TaxID=2511130 RepID=UPI00102145F8|nr:6-carboxytetrahydropterin synthase [Paraburkholderia sp. UYCP14C]RZF23569.1 6-carboxytetrahydropterin synthase [Paraburkholderia sp. UYCP14C]